MSAGQGINLKLFSGVVPWQERFYSSTCDSLFIGGQGDLDGTVNASNRTNCPVVNHSDMGKYQNTLVGKREGMLDDSFFNKNFTSRPYAVTKTDIQDPASYKWYNYINDSNKSWVAEQKTFLSQGKEMYGQNATVNKAGVIEKIPSTGGSNAWDWALNECRNTYGDYVNASFACDDPVCQMETIAQTNPAYFESACNYYYDSACERDEILKAVAIPAGMIALDAAVAVASGGTGAPLIVAGRIGARVAAETALKAAVRTAARAAGTQVQKRAVATLARRAANQLRQQTARAAQRAASGGVRSGGRRSTARAITRSSTVAEKQALQEAQKKWVCASSYASNSATTQALTAARALKRAKQIKKVAQVAIPVAGATGLGVGLYRKVEGKEAKYGGLDLNSDTMTYVEYGAMGGGALAAKGGWGVYSQLKNANVLSRKDALLKKACPDSLLANALNVGTSAYVGTQVAKEYCYSCLPNIQYFQSDDVKNKGFNQFNFPIYNQEFVKPYCFVPNRRGSENYCPVFGDQLALEKGTITPQGERIPGSKYNIMDTLSDTALRYQGSILGTTDYEKPESRPYWSLDDTHSRVVSGQQALHNIIEGDTRPDMWGTGVAQQPNIESLSSSGKRNWNNYGYVCHYNHTDDFITNPVQAENFLSMTVGPISTIDANKYSGFCASPLLLKDLREIDPLNGTYIAGNPKNVYFNECTSSNNIRPNQNSQYRPEVQSSQFTQSLLVDEAKGLVKDRKGHSVDITNMPLKDKINYFYDGNTSYPTRENVLGQYAYALSNITPLPTNPNIPYNTDFQFSDDYGSVLPSNKPMWSGSAPWLRPNQTSLQQLTSATRSNDKYKLPLTYWYEHDTFNKVMADYCIRKGPKIPNKMDVTKEITSEDIAGSSCSLLSQTSARDKTLEDRDNPINEFADRTYCPNMFVQQAGGTTGTSDTVGCYNCSTAEGEAALRMNNNVMPTPTDVCGKWYEGMIMAYRNLSTITQQNPTHIFSEYNKAVKEYCNQPKHRDLAECSCYNADNVNNPSSRWFDLWSSIENNVPGVKGMNYCWLTPCKADQGSFHGVNNESFINFKNPASYVNALNQGDFPWKGKCPNLSCQEFLIFTDNTNLDDVTINSGIHACGSETASQHGYACNQVTGQCERGGLYIGQQDPVYNMTEKTCKEKCQKMPPGTVECVPQYYQCMDGEFKETDQYTNFWNGHSVCSLPNPPGVFEYTSAPAREICRQKPFTPVEEENLSKFIYILILVIVFVLLSFLIYFTMIRKKKGVIYKHG